MKTEFEKKSESPKYRFLDIKEILNEFNSIANQKYNGNYNLKVLNSKNEITTGSNSYSVFLMSEILPKYGLRTIDLTDIQKIDKNLLSDFYIDLGIALRTEDKPNVYLAKQLAKQSRDRKYEFSNENPLVFKPSDLELILDDDSPSKLGFKIKDSATPFNLEELNNKNNYKSLKITNDGILIFDKEGDKTNYTRNGGLSRFGLIGFGALSSERSSLGSSDDYGRIIVSNDLKDVI